QHNAAIFGSTRGIESTGLPIDQKFALRRLFVATKYLHEGGLAGTIFAEQTVYLATLQAEADIVQDPHGAEVLADRPEFYGQAHQALSRSTSLCGSSTAVVGVRGSSSCLSKA